MKKCDKCKTLYDDDVNFCKSCGGELTPWGGAVPTLIGCMLVICLFAFLVAAWPYFQWDILNDLGGDRAKFYNRIFFITSIIPAILLPVSGKLIDVLTTRKILIFTFLVSGGCYLVVSRASSTDLIIILRTFSTAAAFLGLVTCLFVLVSSFKKSLGLVLGCAAAAHGISYFASTELTGLLVQNYGWRQSSLIIGGCSGLVGIIAALLLIGTYSRAQKPGAISTAISNMDLWKIAFFALAFGVATGSANMFYFHLLETLSLSGAVVGKYMITWMIIAVAASPLLGVACDRFGSTKTLAVGCFLFAVGSIFPVISDTPGSFFCFLAAFGLIIASTRTIVPLLVAETTGTACFGIIYGALISFTIIGKMMGSIFFASKTESFPSTLLIAAILLLGCAVMFLMPEFKRSAN